MKVFKFSLTPKERPRGAREKLDSAAPRPCPLSVSNHTANRHGLGVGGNCGAHLSSFCAAHSGPDAGAREIRSRIALLAFESEIGSEIKTQ